MEQSENELKQDKTDSKNLEYDRNISLADQAFKEKKYGLAVNYYKQALTIKPGDAYPINQLSIIDGILKK